MNDNTLYIRCPTCRTVFRTQDWTLELQAGKVRCGQCRMVFNGRSNLVEVAFDDAATDTETLHSTSAGFESDESHGVPSGMSRDLARELDDHAAAFERDARDHPAGASATTSGGLGPRLTASEVDERDRPEPTLGADGYASPLPLRDVPSFDNDMHRPIATEPLEDTGPATTSRSSPATTSDSSPHTPRTPFPEIGIERDPLGIEAMPKAGGPDTITTADTGPPTRSRFVQRSDAMGEPLTGNTLARSGPTTRSGRAPADPVLRHDAVVMPDWKTPAPPPRRGARWLYSVLSVLLFVGLLAQALFHYRNVIAADYPVTRHHLVAACTTIGCRIEPLRNRDEIAIESHDLQADPAHQGLLILQTTLRNQSRHALAFPHLELELDDNAGKPIVRRAFTPIEYAGGAADFSLGIPANSEWNVKLFLDASSVAAGAYHLYHFYP